MQHNEKTVSATQFCTHAATYFATASKALKTHGMDTTFEQFVIEVLCESQHFMLPTNGILSEVFDYSPSAFDLQRLPYPVCALEFFADGKLYDETSGNFESHKRIALCFDPHTLPTSLKSKFQALAGDNLCLVPEHAICVMSVWAFVFAPDQWVASTGVTIIDLKSGPTASQLHSGAHALAVVALPFQSTVTKYNMQAYGWNIESLLNDTKDELHAMYDLLANLNASAIDCEEIKAPKFSNKMRIGKGKIPFYSYKKLKIVLPKKAKVPPVHLGGTHASPREHDRLGHNRTYKTPNGTYTIWIKQMKINSGSKKGKVEKSYLVQSACNSTHQVA
jgi:hypothetical protein